MTLEQLLASLDTPTGMEKVASIKDDGVKPALSDEITAVLTKSASEDMTKQAFAEGEKAAKELLSQLQGNPMNKQAQLAGKDLANSILTKLAEELGQGTPAAATSPPVNQIQAENAQMEAESAAKILPTPEGNVNQILEQIVQRAQAEGAGVDNIATEHGATGIPEETDDEVEKAAAVTTLVGSGYDFDTAINLVKQAAFAIAQEEDAIEKSAAINNLMAQGYDFDAAVNYVQAVESEWTKQAAMENLMSQGYDFDTAVELVKEAGAKELWEGANRGGKVVSDSIRGAVGGVRDHSLGLYNAAKNGMGGQYLLSAGEAGVDAVKGQAAMAGGKIKAGYAATVREGKDFKDTIKTLATNKMDGNDLGKGGRGRTAAYLAKNNIARGLAGAGVVGGGAAGYAAYRSHEKKSALEALLSNGIDFDSAVNMVKQAEYDVYGA